MRRFLTLTILLATFLLVTSPTLYTQSKREVLTNEKIIELVRLGLGEALIIEKIRQSECQCDTSTTALPKLKAAKVSDQIIMAMLNSSADPTSSNPKNNNDDKNTPAVDPNASPETKALSQISEPGIYLFENGEMKAIEPSVFSGSKMNPLWGSLTYGIKKTKYRAKVRGKSANMQTSDSQPVFYFVFNPDYKNSGATMAGGLWWGMPATSPAEFMLVQMDQKKASREAVLGEFGVWTGVSMGARDKDIREYAFDKIKTGIYKVVPKQSLIPGEYCFYFASNVMGLGMAGGKIFDFTIISKL